MKRFYKFFGMLCTFVISVGIVTTNIPSAYGIYQPKVPNKCLKK